MPNFEAKSELQALLTRMNSCATAEICIAILNEIEAQTPVGCVYCGCILAKVKGKANRLRARQELMMACVPLRVEIQNSGIKQLVLF